MELPKRYDHRDVEPRLQTAWQEDGIYRFSLDAAGPIFSIDTPPPTVSGNLHLGHCYSYSHADFLARYQRMRGRNVFYPMGFDDNGLPTERLVEKVRGVTVQQIGRSAFIRACLEISDEIEADYRTLWRRFGLSVDWRYTYRTIDDDSRRTSQLSFLELYRKGLAYRDRAPSIWCPECGTAIAQAEVSDLERESEFVTLAFRREDGAVLPIATTRPELLPACVAVFVHPDDPRFRDLIGRSVRVPPIDREVPLLADPAADPEKGSGAVMCCTFGDTADVAWWLAHKLPLVVLIGQDGTLTEAGGELAGLSVAEARHRIVEELEEAGAVLGRERVSQVVRVHERCDTPVEYVVTPQWFVRVLEFKEELLAAGDQIVWHPPHMKARYRDWVEDLRWDWLISRQRYFGVPFPVWTCDACGQLLLADDDQLPIDPTETDPPRPCPCGGTSFTPDQDVMDTWATSSLSPQIVGRWLSDPDLYERVYPMSLRPQAHEIIRTWTFYTIVKSFHHFGAVPWREVALSGWGLAPEGAGKISKSRGGGGVPTPTETIEAYGADAVRYWAASTGFGRDTIISEEKIQAGAKLVTKLWNVARFSQRFLADYTPPASSPVGALAPTDRWLLARVQRVIRRTSELFDEYDYAGAKAEVEAFFWRDLADNYLELAKDRLYGADQPGHEGARYALYHALLTTLTLFAPVLPHVTEEIYRSLFVAEDGCSLHRSSWPDGDPDLEDEPAEALGETILEIVGAVRRFKSDRQLSVGAKLQRVQIAVNEPGLAAGLREAAIDLACVTRAIALDIAGSLDTGLERLAVDGVVQIGVAPLDAPPS
jgi:valyl-tRNA synthetase